MEGRSNFCKLPVLLLFIYVHNTSNVDVHSISVYMRFMENIDAWKRLVWTYSADITTQFNWEPCTQIEKGLPFDLLKSFFDKVFTHVNICLLHI